MAAPAAQKPATNKLKIAVIPGDGIGNEVVPEGIRVLEAVGARFGIDYAWDHLDWSCQRFAKTGAMMPADGLDADRQARCHLSSAPSAGPACPTTSRCGAC